MRDDSSRVLTTHTAVLALLGAAALLGPARAQPSAAREPNPDVRVELAPEQQLAAGSHALIAVVVVLPPGNDAPLLLTPSLEGNAVEVVRGRLSRSDGKPQPGNALRFEIPVIARSEGTAILRVEVMTYVCARTCRRVLREASQVIRVR